MHDYDYFFLSYARANHVNAKWEKQGNSGNYLDEFVDALCREVSDQTGRREDAVAYRDRSRLRIADFWNRDLVAGLQRSRVLVSLISPHYLESSNCGRELAFFEKRMEEYARGGGNGDGRTHRILPLFWQNSELCLKRASAGTSQFLKKFNFSQDGMPTNYPAVGLSQICKLRTGNDYEQLCHTLAKRIVELADELPPLPSLTGAGEFEEIESIYSRLAREAGDEVVLSGPGGVNVVFAVGTRTEMIEIRGSKAERYGDKRDGWCPFPEAPGATVKILTEEGLRLAGLEELRSLDFDQDLMGIIEAAQRRRSPVLIVLDRASLPLARLTTEMSRYDQDRNFEHCGLITAGGSEVEDDEVRKVFKFKGTPNYSCHLWDVPRNRETYVRSVASVVSSIKKQLLNYPPSTTAFRRTAMPGLTAPSGS